jgi:hypothetical protein
MIAITGTARRSFIFPAALPTACAFFSNYRRLLGYLPHVEPVNLYAPHQARMLYHTIELGVYRVRIYCDLEACLDEKRHILRVVPLAGRPPVQSHVTLNSLTAYGTFASETTFRAARHHTRVEYHLTLNAQLPKPLGLALIPDTVLKRIAHEITVWRIHEIADGFIERAIREFEGQKRRRKS